MTVETEELTIVADLCGGPNMDLVVAALRAGSIGLLDLPDATSAPGLLQRTLDRAAGPLWIRPGADPALATVVAECIAARPGRIHSVVLGATSGADTDTVARWIAAGLRVVALVHSRPEAEAALAAGAGGLIASGSEAGGAVGETESCILVQQLVDIGVPVWARGGIGLHTAAAAMAAGAAGVVLDSQLALVKESRLGRAARQAVTAMDGSETRVVGGHRFFTRPDLPAALVEETASASEIAARLGPDLSTDLLPVGQDGAFAAGLARRFVTVGGVVQAVRAAMASHQEQARRLQPLAPGAGVAAVHGTRYPITQGPMTRVSDRAAFARSVAEGGGLPFLALALMSGPEVRTLMEETAALLGDLPWGVGVLGFVPAEIRAEQLEVVHDIRPPHALIAGGRPSQAVPLEEAGINTYLHVPSPGLLDRFVKDGARKFVFEGRECGGHVGPRSSFALWEAQIERLLAVPDAENLQLLFAGGIHDARSAAMVATAAAPLAERGAHIGVLMGTAYLFTTEAVDGGAILPTFQQVAVECERTMLLETSPGHATRCVETEFVRTFAGRKAELEAAGVDVKDRWAELETLNLGRLRIASKGLARGESGLEELDEATQRSDGMYMIGEVATLRHEVTTIAALHADVSEGGTARLVGEQGTPVGGAIARERTPEPLDIAIIGMDAFLPGARGADEFWANVVAGTNHISEVPPERWDVERYYDSEAFTRDAGRKTPSRWGGFLDEIGFDPFAYGIPPASLAAIEPVQLLSLEVAARALADAGYATREFDRERASVIFGAEAGNELGAAYGARAFLPQLFGDVPPELEDFLPSLTEDSFPGVLTNVIAGRIANRLDLGGVNYTVDSACASSLTAVDAACKELRSGISDLVVCGGADLHNGLNDYLMFASVHALSPTGQCRTFDAAADGIALGEGIAAVVLKRRVDAERDGDRIYAVIDAVAGSSDGRHLGLTAPRKEGQQRAVIRAWEQAGRPATSLGLVEAHGTGTVVGDRTEMANLTELFAEAGAEPGSVVLGSVKSQIGHTKCAAGLAGLMKAAQAVYRGVLPPTVNLTEPNSYYDPETNPFQFLDRARPWPAATRRAGVSAFGFGGTNFHTVLSSHDGADRPDHGLDQWPAELFVFRGDTVAEAQAAAAELADLLVRIEAVDPTGERHRLRDLARTAAATGRGPVRIALVADDLADLATKLASAAHGADVRNGVFVASDTDGATNGAGPAAPAGSIAFLYPGQGSQRPAMTADLFVAFGWLRDLLSAGEPWLDVLFPPAAFSREQRAEQLAAITETDVAQPTLGIASLAITRVLGRLGITPAVAGGHSYGELVALAVAGGFGHQDDALLALSWARGRAILDAIAGSGGDPGTMAAVDIERADLDRRLPDWPTLVVANHNGPRQSVLSGPTADVEAAVDALGAEGIKAKLLPVACAFHSSVIAEAGDHLAATLADVTLEPLQFPVWSNLTAEPYPSDPDQVRSLLARQVVSPVRFVDQIEDMYAAGVRVFVEAGPGRVLTMQVDKILGDRPHHAVACDASGEHGVRRLLLAVAELATLGADVDLDPLFDGRAEVLDRHALPLARPGWLIDGAFVRTADGALVRNSLQPANAMPALSFGSPLGGGGSEQDLTVLEYLRNVRAQVAAERDVMLRYLGGTVPASAPLDVSLAPAATLPAASVAATTNGAAAPAARAALTGDALLAAVLAIVSERTGYPVDMLDPDLDLEADLSIDSIKRIEIVGELAERVGLPGMDEAAAGGIDESVVEELAQLKTLRGIVEWIDELAASQPAAPVAAGPATASAAGGRPILSGDALLGAVLAIVSERTGYPVDMLDPDLDLEADLSIDSIKRIEIVGELAERVGLPGMDEAAAGGIDESVVEELAQLKTLRGIVDWIDDLAGAGPAPTPAPATTQAESAPGDHDGPAVPKRAGRYELGIVSLGPAVPRDTFAGDRVVVVGGPAALAEAVSAELSGRGAEVVRHPACGPGLPIDPAVVAAVAEADAVVDLSTAAVDAIGDARSVFAVLQPALLGAARRVLAVSSAGDAELPGASGVPGLARALAREFPEALIRSVEVDALASSGDQEPLAAALVDEILDPDAPASVSWVGGQRTTRVVVESPSAEVDTALAFTEQSVVLLTGGARGITARVALAMAGIAPGRIVLVGRSSEPAAEDPRTASAPDRAALRRTLLGIGELRSPAAIEAACERILADREIRATLDGIRAFGATVEYHAVDVRDAALGAVIDKVYERHGRLDVVIHGAGVLDDRFVRDKTAEGFDRVFGTKVDGARTILAHVRSGTRVVLFGSVSGVFGNRGQCDYAAANDALDSLARTAPVAHGAHVMSIDWGPWQGGGMVSPELEREYARRGIGLIDPNDGTFALLAELVRAPGPSQVVVMRGQPEAFGGSGRTSTAVVADVTEDLGGVALGD